MKSIASNGSGGENFSTDDAEEVNNFKTPPSTNNDTLVTNDDKTISTSKLEFIIIMTFFPITGKSYFVMHE